MPFEQPRGFAVEFGHDRIRRHAFRDSLAVLAITRDDVIVWPQSRDGADADRFLADVQMAEAANFSEAVRLSALLFKAPNQQHLME